MDYEIFKTVGAAAGVGGIGIGAVILIFRRILSLKIFPQLTKEQSFKLLNRMVVLSFCIGVLGILAYFFLNYRESKTVGAQSTTLNNTTVNQDFRKTQNTVINKSTIVKNMTNLPSADTNTSTNETSSKTGATCRAWDVPIFNPYPVTYADNNIPFCHDFPMIDVIKDNKVTVWSQSEAEYTSVRRFKSGDVIVVGLYMDNGGIDTTEYTAKNVNIKTQLITEGNRHRIVATFSGDNVASKTGEILVETDNDERLEIIPNSGLMYSYEGSVVMDQRNLNLGNSTYILGDLDPGFQYSLFFTYKINVLKNA